MLASEALTWTLSLIVLTVLADLWLIHWARQRYTHNDAAGQDSVFLFGSYSPVLSWLKRAWQTLLRKLSSAKKSSHPDQHQSIDTISSDVPISEHSHVRDPQPEASNRMLNDHAPTATQSSTPPKASDDLTFEALFPTINLRQDVFPILFLSAASFLTLVPPVLVFRNRWLGQDNVQTPFNDLWNKVWNSTNIGLPPYFATIVLCAIALLALILLSRDTLVLQRDEASPSSHQGQRPLAAPAQFRQGLRLLVGGLVISGATFALNYFTPDLTSWGFLIGLILYITGWIWCEIPLGEMVRFVQREWDVIAAFLLSHLALIYAIKSYNAIWDTNRASIWVFLLSLVNLLRFYRRVPLIFWIINLALVLFTLQINNWAFSVVGDEYIFFERGQEIATRYDLSMIVQNFFGGKMVYGAHPFISSLLQGLSMRFFGVDSFGWRFSSLYLAALSIGFFFYFFKVFLPSSTATIAALLLACSSYIMSFGKIGYNNLQAIFTLSLSLAAAAWAVHSQRRLAFVALGLSLGFCLYVYPAAMYALAPPLILLLFYYPPLNKDALRNWGILLVSFLFLLSPLLLQSDYWQAKLPGLWINNPELIREAGGTIFHLFSNILLSLFSFLYIVEETHFVASAYTDPLSAAFVLLGLALAIKRFRRERFLAYLVVSFIVMLFLVGVSHDRRFPPTTRMFMLLPWFAAFAALGLVWLVQKLKAIRFVALKPVTLTSLLLVAVLGLNLYQAYPLSRQRSTGQQHIEMLFIRLVQERLIDFDPFAMSPKTFLFITTPDWSIDGLILQGRVYGYPAARLRLDRLVVEEPSLPENELDRVQNIDTIVILQPSLDQEWQDAIDESLRGLGKEPCLVREFTNRSVRFTLYTAPERQPLCPSSQ